MLYQGDIKYGPYLPIGKNGAKKQFYLSAFIDDVTQFVVSAKFYENQKVEIIEDTLRSAIMSYGKPDAIYVNKASSIARNGLKEHAQGLASSFYLQSPTTRRGKAKSRPSTAEWIHSFRKFLDEYKFA